MFEDLDLRPAELIAVREMFDQLKERTDYPAEAFVNMVTEVVGGDRVTEAEENYEDLAREFDGIESELSEAQDEIATMERQIEEYLETIDDLNKEVESLNEQLEDQAQEAQEAIEALRGWD